jgi:hypothetical protein
MKQRIISFVLLAGSIHNLGAMDHSGIDAMYDPVTREYFVLFPYSFPHNAGGGISNRDVAINRSYRDLQEWYQHIVGGYWINTDTYETDNTGNNEIRHENNEIVVRKPWHIIPYESQHITLSMVCIVMLCVLSGKE